MIKRTAHNDARASILERLASEVYRTRLRDARLRLVLLTARRLLHPVSKQAAHPDADPT